MIKRTMKGRGYNLNLKLTTDEITAYRKGQHTTESRSMSAFVRECVQRRLDEIERNADPRKALLHQWTTLLGICGLTEQDLTIEAREQLQRMSSNPLLNKAKASDEMEEADKSNGDATTVPTILGESGEST